MANGEDASPGPDKPGSDQPGLDKILEFWFDYSSPYAYFAALEIDELARRHGRRAVWRPFLLGVVFKTTGMVPLVQQPLRGEYALRDWARLARRKSVPFRFPDRFPVAASAPSRMFYAIDSRDPHAAPRFAKRCFSAYFEEGRDISEVSVAAACGRDVGLDPGELTAANEDAAVKSLLRERTQEAVAKGVFGAPFIIVDGEPFWGSDRLSMVDDWLRDGGW